MPRGRKPYKKHLDDLSFLKEDFEQAKKDLEALQTNQLKGLDLDQFIFNKFSTRLDPIFYIENVLRAHLPESRRHLHANQVELVRAVCNPKIRKVAAMMARQCLASDTLVLMPDDTYQPIHLLSLYDRVKTPTGIASIIFKTEGISKLYRIIPDNYSSYLVTDNHKLALCINNQFINMTVKELISEYQYSIPDNIVGYGYKNNTIYFYHFTIRPDKIQKYVGITLDDNKNLFMITKDNIVTNNSGKSESIASFSGFLLDNYPNMRIGIFTPRLQQAEVTIGRLSIFFQMNEERLNNHIVKCNKAKIELSNHSFISAVSASDQSNIEGLTFDIIVLDEAQKVSNYTWSERILPMAGSCRLASEQVQLVDGRISTIGELVTSRLNNIEVVSYNYNNQQLSSGTITNYLDKGIYSVMIFTLESGIKFSATNDHKFITLNNEWIIANDIQIGTYIGLPNQLPFFGSYNQSDAFLLGASNILPSNWFTWNKESLNKFLIGLFNNQQSILLDSLSIQDIQNVLLKFGIHGNYSNNILSIPDRIETLLNTTNQSNTLRFEQVTNIEYTRDKVYDIEVEPYHTYIANQVISHNCNGKLVQIGTPKSRNHFYDAIEGKESKQWFVVKRDWTECAQLSLLAATTLPDHTDPTHQRMREYSTFVLSLMPKTLKQEYFPTCPEIWQEGTMSVEDFKTQYMLHFVDGSSQFLTTEEIRQLTDGDFDWLERGIYSELYYAGIDFAGSSSDNADSTHISIVRLDLATNQKQKVFAYEMTGMSYPEQINVIDNLLGGKNPQFFCQAIFADFTGCGRPVVQTLIEERGIKQITGITFNAADTFTHTGMNLKNAMYAYAKQEIDNNRFKYPKIDNFVKVAGKDNMGLWYRQISQWSDLQVEDHGTVNKKLAAPPGGHDDVPSADIMAVYSTIVLTSRKAGMPKPAMARLWR